MTLQTEKTCRICKQTKPVSEFYSAGIGRGLMYRCKRCSNEKLMKYRRSYTSCLAACDAVDLSYDHTVSGFDKFVGVACKRYCCRESIHTNVDGHHFCFAHRKRIVVIINGLRDHLGHRSTFDRTRNDGNAVPEEEPMEAHFMSDGRVRRR